MTKFNKLLFVFLLVLFLTGCSSQSNSNDFWFDYKWMGPQVPAPEHYEYNIFVREDGEGSLSYYPDYMMETVSEDKLWKRDFVVSQSDMDSLYQVMKDSNVFTEKYSIEESVNFREGYGTLSANDKTGSYFVKIHKDLEVVLLSLEDKIKNIIPEEIWQEMKLEHDLDLQSNPDILDYDLPELQY